MERKRQGPTEKAALPQMYPILVRDAVNRLVTVLLTSDPQQRGRTIWLDGTVDGDG